VAPNLLYRWRRLLSEGGAAAVGSDEPVVGSSEVRRLEERVRELERLLGRKTMENENLGKRSPNRRQKKPTLRPLSLPKGRFAVKRIAEVLGVSRSNLADRRSGRTRPRGPCRRADDEGLLPVIRRFVDERPIVRHAPGPRSA